MDQKRSRTGKQTDKRFSVANGLKAILPAATFRSTSNLLEPAPSGTTDSKSRIEEFISVTSQILGLVKEITGALDKVPYVKLAAGLVRQGIDIRKVCNLHYVALPRPDFASEGN